MTALRCLVLFFLISLSLSLACIPTVTPEDMYDDEMEETTSLASMVSEALASTTSPAESTTATASTATTITTSTTTTTTTTGMTTTTTSPTTTSPTTTTTTTSLTTTSTTTPTTTTTTTSSTTTTTTGTGTCPVSFGFTWAYNSDNNFCYYVTMSDGTDAETACGDLVTGAHLASIANAAENTFIYNYITLYFGSVFIQIGGVAMMAGGPFTWTDGTPFTYMNWDSTGSFPTNDGTKLCVAINAMAGDPPQYATWQNVNCSPGLDYLCKVMAT